MRALLIDENPANMGEVELLLKREGIDTLTAQNVDEALQMLAVKSIDLIISAVSFTDKNGFDLYCTLKVNPALVRIPLFFIYGVTDQPELKAELLKAGAHHFLDKPVTKETLVPAVWQMFPGRKIYFKERKLLLAETEFDQKTMLELLNDFLNALKNLSQAVEARAAKSAIHAGFADAQAFAQMAGTDALTALFQHYLSVQAVDLFQLKGDIEELNKQVESLKEAVAKGDKVLAEEEAKADQEKVKALTLKEFSQSMTKILKEAQDGNIDRQYDVAIFYLMGMPELRNPDEGKKWMKRAAENKHPQAICHQALMDMGGQATLGMQEMKTALDQIDFSLQCGRNNETQFWKNALYQGMSALTDASKDGKTSLVCPYTQEEKCICPLDAQHGIACLFHAYKGVPTCQFWMGQLYEQGKAFPAMMIIAAYWLQLSADQGHLEALYRLGSLYQQHLTGYVGEDEKAFQCFEKAAKENHVPSEFCLGRLFHNGVGTEINLGRARYWYEQAAIQKYSHAQYWLGAILEETNTDSNDLREALKWYLISVANGSTMAVDQIPILESKMKPHEVEMSHMSADRYLKALKGIK